MLSKSLAKTIRQDRFRSQQLTTAFARRHPPLCAEITRRQAVKPGSTPISKKLFCDLHRFGPWRIASNAGWRAGLVGGLYGLAMGKAFFGESMFSPRDRCIRSVAMAWLVARMKLGGFELLDCQFMTEHLASRLGAIEISQKHYLDRLEAALTELRLSGFGRGLAFASGRFVFCRGRQGTTACWCFVRRRRLGRARRCLRRRFRP